MPQNSVNGKTRQGKVKEELPNRITKISSIDITVYGYNMFFLPYLRRETIMVTSCLLLWIM